MTLRNANKTQQQQLETRRTQLFMEIKTEFENPEFRKIHVRIMNSKPMEDYKDFLELGRPETDNSKSLDFIRVTSFYNWVGILIALDRIDADLIGMHLGDIPVRAWNTLESLILDRRRQSNGPYLLVYFEFLKDEIMKRESYPRGKASYLKQ